VKNKKISLGDYQSGLSFISNTLAVRSPVISYLIRFSHKFHSSYQLSDLRSFYHKNEVVAVMFSPHVFHHASSEKTGWVRKQGLMIYFLRREDNTQFLYIEARHRPQRRLLETVWTTDFHRFAHKHVFPAEFANRTNEINVTLNFTNLSAAIEFNGVHLTNYPFAADVFPEQKSSLTLMAYTYQDTPVKIGVEELSVYREVPPLESHDQHFHHSMRKLKEAAHTNDPHYRKNMSLSNSFVMSVDSFRGESRKRSSSWTTICT
jgi:hypothetical protein